MTDGDRLPSWLPEGNGAHDATIEANWLFQLRKERFRSRATDRSHDYFVIHLADAVHVIALTLDEQVVFVRQFRAGSGRDSLEPPVGSSTLEKPLALPGPELLEETGYAGGPPVLLGTVWSVPSLLGSRIATVIVPDARRVAAPKLDPTEEVTVELVPVTEVPTLIQDGKIDHALAVMGLFWWLATRPGGLVMPPPG